VTNPFLAKALEDDGLPPRTAKLKADVAAFHDQEKQTRLSDESNRAWDRSYALKHRVVGPLGERDQAKPRRGMVNPHSNEVEHPYAVMQHKLATAGYRIRHGQKASLPKLVRRAGKLAKADTTRTRKTNAAMVATGAVGTQIGLSHTNLANRWADREHANTTTRLTTAQAEREDLAGKPKVTNEQLSHGAIPTPEQKEARSRARKAHGAAQIAADRKVSGVRADLKNIPHRRAVRNRYLLGAGALGAGLAYTGLRRMARKPDPVAKAWTKHDVDATAGGAAAGAGAYSATGMYLVKPHAAEREVQTNPAYRKIWNAHRQASGMGRESYKKYPLSLPGAKRQRFLATHMGGRRGDAAMAGSALLGAGTTLAAVRHHERRKQQEPVVKAQAGRVLRLANVRMSPPTGSPRAAVGGRTWKPASHAEEFGDAMSGAFKSRRLIHGQRRVKYVQHYKNDYGYPETRVRTRDARPDANRDYQQLRGRREKESPHRSSYSVGEAIGSAAGTVSNYPKTAGATAAAVPLVGLKVHADRRQAAAKKAAAQKRRKPVAAPIAKAKTFVPLSAVGRPSAREKPPVNVARIRTALRPASQALARMPIAKYDPPAVQAAQHDRRSTVGTSAFGVEHEIAKAQKKRERNTKTGRKYGATFGAGAATAAAGGIHGGMGLMHRVKDSMGPEFELSRAEKMGEHAHIAGKYTAPLAATLIGTSSLVGAGIGSLSHKHKQRPPRAATAQAGETVAKSVFGIEHAIGKYDHGSITYHHEQANQHARKKTSGKRQVRAGLVTAGVGAGTYGSAHHIGNAYADITHGGYEGYLAGRKVAERGGIAVLAGGGALAGVGAVRALHHGHQQNVQTDAAQAARRSRNASTKAKVRKSAFDVEHDLSKAGLGSIIGGSKDLFGGMKSGLGMASHTPVSAAGKFGSQAGGKLKPLSTAIKANPGKAGLIGGAVGGGSLVAAAKN
jgi:hypothetical protein